MGCVIIGKLSAAKEPRFEKDDLLKPRVSYTIWFSQRTGSTLLCKALEATGIAGEPEEWLYTQDGKDLLTHYGVSDYAALQERLWHLGSTPNGVFGLKYSMHEPHFSKLLEVLRRFPGCPREECLRPKIWEHAFPNSRHIFITRRNKVRLAVSWWKAIKTQEWHRKKGEEKQPIDLDDGYSFEAINHLYCECVMREAAIQEFFSEDGVVPLTVVYEDFIQQFAETIRKVLEYLGLEATTAKIAQPHYEKLADKVSEVWVERFREERQRGWQNRGW